MKKALPISECNLVGNHAHLYRLYPIAGIGAGKLFASPIPDKQKFADCLKLIQDQSVSALVCLLELPELKSHGLQHLPDAIARHGIEFIHCPIADFQTPSLATFTTLIDKLRKRLYQGDNVLVHCRAGIGRTGMVCCGLLIAEGYSPEQAITHVSLKRGCSVPEAAAQHELLRRYHSDLTQQPGSQWAR